jgi:hypothetical protein
MASPETEKLRAQLARFVEESKAWRERDRELSLEVKRHLETLRRLAGSA